MRWVETAILGQALLVSAWELRVGSRGYPVSGFVHGCIFQLPLCFLSIHCLDTLVNSHIHPVTNANVPFFCVRTKISTNQDSQTNATS